MRLWRTNSSTYSSLLCRGNSCPRAKNFLIAAMAFSFKVGDSGLVDLIMGLNLKILGYFLQ